LSSVNHTSPADTPRRVALYGRVSTEDQQERETIKAQIDFLRSFVGLYGLNVAGEYLDDGISGTIPLAERPEGRRLLADIEGGFITEVLVYRLDRLGRSLSALLTAHDQLSKHGVTIRSATEPFDTATPIGTFLFQLLGSLAQLERATITERMTIGRNRVAKAGKWTGGPIPLGYDLDRESRLVPSERIVPVFKIAERDVTESEFLAWIFETIANGGSAAGVCASLNAAGVPCSHRYAPNPTRKPNEHVEDKPVSRRKATRIIRTGEGTEVIGSGQWSLSRILDIVHNPMYHTGIHVMNSRTGVVERPAKPLISTDLWERANGQVKRNKARVPANAREFYALHGLIDCAACGRSYTGTASMMGKRRVRRYRCTGSCNGTIAANLRCKSPIILADRLERLIWNDCVWFIEHPEEGIEEAQRQLRERLGQSVNHEEQRRKLIQQIADKETERERIMTLFRRGRASVDDVERQLDAIAQEEGQLRGMLEAIRAQEAIADALEIQVTNATALLTRFRDELAEIERTDDWRRRRTVIESLVVGITIRTTNDGPRRQTIIEPKYAFGNPETRRMSVAESSTSSPGARPWRRPESSWPSGGFTGALV
jgi:site-specific DNA recombinase